jgi:hypothetical protein
MVGVARPGAGSCRCSSPQSGIQPSVKIVFIPISIVGGLITGAISRKVFDQIWGLFDEEEPPDSKDRDIDWTKLVIAAAIQGAIFRLMKEVSDHYTRRAFYRTTGKWPGEKKPKSK